MSNQSNNIVTNASEADVKSLNLFVRAVATTFLYMEVDLAPGIQLEEFRQWFNCGDLSFGGLSAVEDCYGEIGHSGSVIGTYEVYETETEVGPADESDGYPTVAEPPFDDITMF